MDVKILYEFIKKHNQNHILQVLQSSSLNIKEQILKQVMSLCSYEYTNPFPEPVLDNVLPLEISDYAGSKYEIKVGVNTLFKQETGCVIFAGGEGSRLNKNMPKGLFLIGKDKQSLFSHICRWIAAYNLAFNISIPVIVLVSKKNRHIIESHFEDHKFFNLPKSKILFLEQNNYPYFDLNNRWVFSNQSIMQAANGNGGFLEVFQKASQFLIENQLKYLHFIPIDNPLIDPLDVNLLGFLKTKDLDAAIKSFIKGSHDEKVGVIYTDNDKHLIADYMQILQTMHTPFRYANGGHYCIRTSSLFQAMENKVQLPYHFVKKTVQDSLMLKAEKFAFDIFSYFSKVLSLCYEKASFFAPLKEAKDVPFIEKALHQKHLEIYKNIYGNTMPNQYILTEQDLAIYLQKIYFS